MEVNIVNISNEEIKIKVTDDDLGVLNLLAFPTSKFPNNTALGIPY